MAGCPFHTIGDEECVFHTMPYWLNVFTLYFKASFGDLELLFTQISY